LFDTPWFLNAYSADTQIMKLIRLKIAILVILSSAVSSFAGDVENVSLGDRLAKTNCTWCHGPSAQGFATAPKLAGQQPQYLENQLMKFYNHTRNGPLSQQYMWGAAATLDPKTARDLADYFSTLDVETANDGDKELVAKGQDIFEHGIQTSNVPACAFCHGPNAQGVRDVPRLGGQGYHYLKRTLDQWGEGYYGAAKHMPGIASNLSPNQVEALASYLSFVR
jgi:cbb3-type cytochrome c oxidase subunit III